MDGLRACAALGVLLTHVGFQTGRNFGGTFGDITARLDIGVTLFFLLSGFLLYRPFVVDHLGGRATDSTWSFYARRALRILPGYWLATVLVVLIMGRQFLDQPAEWLRQIFLLQEYRAGELLQGTNHTWSLCTEVAFYLTLPIYAAVLRPRRPTSKSRQLRRELIGVALLVMTALVWPVTYFHGPAQPLVAPLWLPAHLDWFGLGMALAVLSAHLQVTRRVPQWVSDLARAPGTCWLVAAALFWLATTRVAGPNNLTARTWPEEFTRHVLYGLCALFVLLPAVLPSPESHPVRRLIESSPMRHLGRISYGLFLFQLLALDLVFRWTGLDHFDGHFLVVAAFTICLTVALAEISWWAVESPALRLKPRRQAPPAEAA